MEIEQKSDGKKGASEIPVNMVPFLNAGMLGGLIGQKEMPNAINMLVQPGDDMLKILMRVKFRSREERIAAMHIYAQCKEFNDDVGMLELFINVAATVSEQGMGREQLVSAIIGDNNMKQQGGGGGLGAWLKRKAGEISGQPQQ